MTFRELFGPLTGPVAILIGLGLGALWAREQRRKRQIRGALLDTSDPIWLAALDKARASLPRFRELAATHPNGAHIKYALLTTTGATEHVWGEVVSIGDSTIVTGLETPPVDGRPVQPPPYELLMLDIEDWRVEMIDGRIFGAYTMIAQLTLARRLGYEIPTHMLEIEKNLVDA